MAFVKRTKAEEYEVVKSDGEKIATLEEAEAKTPKEEKGAEVSPADRP